MSIELNSWKEEWFYGVTILWMGDLKRYEFRRNYEKDLLGYVTTDQHTINNLQQFSKDIETKFHLKVVNLDTILKTLPHSKEHAVKIVR